MCIERFLTNFCWRGRCEFEAWLNFTRVASRSLFLELLIEILLKELIWWQMITRRGSASKFLPWMFLLDYIELFLSIRGCLVIRSFLADAFLATLVIFHSACNFDTVRLNDKILPKSEQDLKFFKQITEHF